MSAQFEHERFLRVVAMSAKSAKAFAMPDAVKVVYAGQADAARYKFGARVYHLFQTWDDYQAYLRDHDEVPTANLRALSRKNDVDDAGEVAP